MVKRLSQNAGRALSADLFNKLASSVPSILFAFWQDPDGKSQAFPYISDHVLHRFGIEPEMLKQTAEPLFALIHAEDLPGVGDSILESAHDFEPWQCRARLRLPDGSYEWFEGHSRPERQADGSIVWYGQFFNVQHYKDLEKELRASETEHSFQAGFQKLVARLSSEFINQGFGTIDECIGKLLQSVGQFFDMDRAYLYAFNDKYTAITKTHQWRRPGVTALVDKDETIAVDAFDCWRERLLAMVNENRQVPGEDRDDNLSGVEVVHDHSPSADAASVFCVPVRVQGRVVGFLGLDSLAPRDWRGDLGDLLTIVSGLLSGALERNLLEEQLLSQSIRDPMTGLHNRRYLMPRLNELVERAERYDENFTIAMIDIDHFKQINDSTGHLGGDYTLRHFAEIVTDLVRATDVVARFGGEEFIVVFPGTEQASVRQMIGRILNAVRQGHFVFDRRLIPVTVSIGVASARESEDHMMSVDAVIGRADHRLYLAKQAGRDGAVDVSGPMGL